MPFSRTHLPLLFSAALVCSTAGLAADDPFALDQGSAPTTDIENTLDWSDKHVGSGLNKLVLPEYSIEFLMDNSASSAAGNTSVSMKWQLQGVGAAEFQAITDAAHADLRRALEAAGFDLVSVADMSAHPAYAKMQAQGQATGTATPAGVVMAPAGMVVMPLGTLSERGGGLLDSVRAIGAVGSAISGAFDTNEMAQGLDATVLQLHIAVDFSQVEGKRGLAQRFSGEASVEGSAQPSIAASSTALRLFSPTQQGGQLTLQQPLLLPADTFSGSSEATSTATKVGDAAGALLRFGAGISGSSRTREYVVTAEPEQYKLRMVEALSQLNAAIVSHLLRLR